MTRRNPIAYFHLWLPALLLLLPACKKWFSRTTEAEVLVVEKGSMQAVEEAEVALFRITASTLLGGPPAMELIETCTTGQHGLCRFVFEPEKDGTYEVQARHPNYYRDRNSYKLEKGKENHQVIKLQPEAWLKVYVKNINKEYNRFFLDGYGTPGGGGGTFYWLDVNTFTIARLWGNHTKTLTYAYYNSGQPYEEREKFEIDIYCPAHDTTEYTIEY